MNADRIAKLFNLSEDDVSKIRAQQKECCAICGSLLKTKPNIDHNHITGLIRGILCWRCNKALGLFRDSQKFLLAALGYLNMPSAVLAIGERFGCIGRVTNKRRAEDATRRRRKGGGALPRAAHKGVGQ